MKENVKKIIIIIMSFVLLILLVFLGYYFVYQNKNYQIDESIISDYLEKLPFNNDRIGIYKDAYFGEYVVINDVIPSIMDTFVYKYKPNDLYFNNYKNNDYDEYYYNYDEEEVNQLLLGKKNKERYIVHLKANIIDYMTNNFNGYYLSLKENENILVVVPKENTSKYIEFVIINDKKASSSKKIILNLEKKNDGEDIIIYEKALFAVKENENYSIYKNSNISDNKNKLKEINSSDLKVVKKNLKPKEFTEFKHTFKKNTLGYYWYSTEIVE